MSGERVLIVDDNPANLKLLVILLEKHGYAVQTAADAEEALECLRRNLPDMLLLDLQLPDMDGLDLARKLKAAPETSDVAIVAVTAFAMRGDQERVREAGCDAYVAKPIDTRSLPDLLRETLANRVRRGSA